MKGGIVPKSAKGGVNHYEQQMMIISPKQQSPTTAISNNNHGLSKPQVLQRFWTQTVPSLIEKEVISLDRKDVEDP